MSEQERLTLQVFPQDPRHTRDHVPVQVRGGLLPGPVGDRVAVFDYNRDRDEVYAAARPRNDGTFPQYDPGDLRFHQLNAYAIVARAVELVELELGRDLRWGFEASRLILLPHAGYLANAFYSEDTHSLQFYSFKPGGRGRVYHTSLCHDIVAHETGHAVLDAVRDRFTEANELETAALHEALADLTALFAALSHEVIQRRVADCLTRPNMVTEIAEDFEGPRGNLRTLLGEPRDWEGITQPHELSLKLTRAIYDALCRLHRQELSSGREAVPALRVARRVLQRMVVRSLDYLPPADATFEDFAVAILAADAFSHSADPRGYRKTVETALVEHGLLTREAAAGALETSARRFRGLPRTWPRPTLREAYLFLNGNRRRLALHPYPRYRDFVVRDVYTTSSPIERRLEKQVVIVYEYPVDVELKGRDFGPAEGHWLTIWGGGGLVFDVDGVLRHHAEKPVTRARVRDALTFLRSELGRGTAGVAWPSLDDEIRRDATGRPWMLNLSARTAVLHTNPSARCRRGPP